jgi:hypothetical protein
LDIWTFVYYHFLFVLHQLHAKITREETRFAIQELVQEPMEQLVSEVIGGALNSSPTLFFQLWK